MNDKFKLYLLKNGFAQETIRRTLTIVKSYPYNDFSVSKIEKWMIDKKQSGVKNKTINGYIKCLKRYKKFLGDNDTDQIAKLPEEKAIKKTLSISEIERFLEIEQEDTKMTQAVFKRWQLFFYLLIRTGARPGEIRSISVHQFNRSSLSLTLNATKVNRIRTVPIDNDSIEMLDSLLTIKHEDKPFIKCINQKTSKVFKEWRKIANIPDQPGLTVYSFRHSLATRLIEAENVEITDVQAMLGHSSIKTTIENYYHMSAKRLAKVIMKDPLNRSDLSNKERFKLISELIRESGLIDDSFDVTEKKGSDRYVLDIKIN